MYIKLHKCKTFKKQNVKGMFLIPLRALRIETVPPLSPFIGVEQEEKSSFLVMGQLQTMLSCFSTPNSEG